MQRHSFETIGTTFTITIWDTSTPDYFQAHIDDCTSLAESFDQQYSRFKPDSLISQLAHTTGTVEVPRDLVTMLRLYEQLAVATNNKLTPTIGVALEDSGYDATYSLREKEDKRTVPTFSEALRIEDDTHITLHQPVLLDLGALGKGYLIDVLYELLRERSCQQFLIDGSGDIRYHGSAPIMAGLENPDNTNEAIGTLAVAGGALYASAINRRSWGDSRHHYIDATSGESPQHIVATWVIAETAVLADALSSALFFTAPESLTAFSFEYLIMNHERNVKRSAAFAAELFH